MNYEEAIVDATLAHNILPQRMDAYYVLSDFLVAMNQHQAALKILEILNAHEGNTNPIIKNQYEMIKQSVDSQKAPVQSKQQQRQARQIKAAQKNCMYKLSGKVEAIKGFLED